MQFAFIRPKKYSAWGGDLKAILDLQEGLQEFGYSSFITDDHVKALQAETVIFIGTLFDQSSGLNFMRLMQRDYGCIAFHEDELLYSGASFGFLYYIAQILEKNNGAATDFSLEDLLERPHLIFYYQSKPPDTILKNYDFLKKAKWIIAHSHMEQKTLFRDAPGCNAKIVYLGAGHAGNLQTETTEEFLRFTGLSKKSYILQVGRLSSRKNQIATVIATKDLDIPLVFIAMNNCNPLYERLFVAAVLKWRKAPTILISQHLSASDSIGPLRVIPTLDGNILPKEMLLSAFAHAGLHIHPAFYELPGYTYLESARFGIPTIASTWTSLKDYFTDFSTGKYTLDDRIEYAIPYDITSLTQLTEKKFGQIYPKYPFHPLFSRTPKDIAKDFLTNIH